MEPYIIFSLFMLGLLRLFLWQMIAYRLRIYHNDVYISMGGPEVMRVLQRTNRPRIRKFIYGMEFKGIDDRWITLFAWAALLIEGCVVMAFFIMFVWVIYI